MVFAPPGGVTIKGRALPSVMHQHNSAWRPECFCLLRYPQLLVPSCWHCLTCTSTLMTNFLTSSWTSHSSVFGVNLAPCWLPTWLHVGSMLASSWPHVGSSWLENRPKCGPNRFILALGEGLGGILGVLWGCLGARSAPRWFQDPQSESFDPLLAAILEAKIDQKSNLRLS